MPYPFGDGGKSFFLQIKPKAVFLCPLIAKEIFPRIFLYFSIGVVEYPDKIIHLIASSIQVKLFISLLVFLS